MDELKRRYEKMQKKLDKARSASSHHKQNGGNSGGMKDEDAEYRELLEFENEELKKQVNCPIIKEKIKNVVLMKCGHAFSRDAIDKRVSDRMRRCPACNKGFGVDDVKPIFLTS
jgi:SUMO ligase MMS21 Smc5/6 complex component